MKKTHKDINIFENICIFDIICILIVSIVSIFAILHTIKYDNKPIDKVVSIEQPTKDEVVISDRPILKKEHPANEVITFCGVLEEEYGLIISDDDKISLIDGNESYRNIIDKYIGGNK